MTIPSPFQIRLQSYGIDAVTERYRLEVGKLLAPCLSGLVSEQIDSSVRAVPFYAAHVSNNRQSLQKTVFDSTLKLFTKPFDEQWVEDAKARAQYESRLGFDMRTRGTINRFLLSGMLGVLRRHSRFSTKRFSCLADTAMRIMMLDTANAVACHNNLSLDKGATRSEELKKAIDSFSAVISRVQDAVGNVSQTLVDTSTRLGGLAQTATERARIATGAASDAAVNIEIIAGATEELSSAIAVIHRQANASEGISQKAVDKANSSDAAIQDLGSAIGKVGSVVDLISQIAHQTNLLALNAAIEAARAGDAGRGFAIVASEVKALALQTSKATGEIGSEIAIIQDATKRSVVELGGAGARIKEMANFAQSVAASVEEQSAATNEIATSANAAASNSNRAAQEFGAVEAVILEANSEARSVLGLAAELTTRRMELEAAFKGLIDATSQQRQMLEGFMDLSSAATMQLEGRAAKRG
jgi:methyl-accepting chemotaxis protein